MLQEARAELQKGKGSLRCGDIIRILESLGFVVAKNRRGLHHSYNHPGIEGWWGSNFGCPHRGSVDPNYITNILRVLRTYEQELLDYLGENDE